MQNRIVKNIVNASTGISEKTYYIRDAQGNIMAIYELKNGELRWSEQQLYGSGRVGTYETNSVAYPVPVDPNSPTGNGLSVLLPSGARRYELSNHLGNVLCVLSDVKRPVLEGSTTFFETDRLSTNDYYPFGMLMPGRKASLDVYRFGFNGKENDNEAKGEGNQQDYGMRIYDPRVGRFLSVDPLMGKYPWNSVYAFAENDVIRSVDLDGEERKVVIMFKVNSPVSGDNIDERRTEITKVSDEEIWHNNQRVAVTEVFIFDEKSEAPEHYQFVEAVDAITGRMENGFYPTAKYNLAHLSEGYESDQAYEDNDVNWYGLFNRKLWNFAEHLQTAPEKIVEMEAFDQAMTAIMRNSPRNSSNKDLVGFAKKGGKSSAAKGGSTAANRLGQQMHKAYKAGDVLDGVRIKEFRLPSRKRIDFIDLENKIIYELKPNNPRAIKQGYKQLEMYKQEVESIYGKGFKTVLDTY